MDRSASVAHHKLLDEIRSGLKNERRREALYFGTEQDRERSEKAYSEFPDSADLLGRVRRIKREAIDRLDENLERFVQAAKQNGVEVHLADDATSAVRVVADIVRGAGARRIVKSKSMTGEEIDLRQHLEREGFDVIETDLGERIVQLADQRPSHIFAPALHMDVEEIADVFSRKCGVELPEDPEKITAFARESLREKFLQSEVGLIGANFAFADSGAVAIVTNEGNGRLVTALPPLLVVVMGVEKIVAATSDFFALTQALVLSSVGKRLTSYVTLVKGGSGIIRNELRQKLHIVIVDNGRSKMRAHPIFRDALYCLRCGACMDTCPTFRLFGGHVFGYIYPGPMGVPWTKYTATPDKAGEFASLCISCGLCKSACPEDIDIPFLIAKLKEEYAARHGQTQVNRTLCNYETFVGFASACAPLANYFMKRHFFRRLLEEVSGIDSRRQFPRFTRRTFKKWFGSHLSKGSAKAAYFVDTYADMCEPEIGQAVVRILEINDHEVSLPTQIGSGMPAFLYGDVKRATRAARFNVQHLADAVRSGCEIISSEPTATYCLRELYPKLLCTTEAGLVATHSHDLFDFLLQLRRDGKLRKDIPNAMDLSAVYYPPCHTRSVYGTSPCYEFLRLAGADLRTVRYRTCCGIAGTFGFKKGAEGYDVSMAVGETLFERIRAMNPSLVITESSVCKMHIEHGTSLGVVHPAIALRNIYGNELAQPE
jgi:iron-sulfur cluster protein